MMARVGVVPACGTHSVVRLRSVAPQHPRPESDSPGREGQAAGEAHRDGGRRVVPDADHGVECRIVVGDEVEHRISTGGGKGRPGLHRGGGEI